MLMLPLKSFCYLKIQTQFKGFRTKSLYQRIIPEKQVILIEMFIHASVCFGMLECLEKIPTVKPKDAVN